MGDSGSGAMLEDEQPEESGEASAAAQGALNAGNTRRSLLQQVKGGEVLEVTVSSTSRLGKRYAAIGRAQVQINGVKVAIPLDEPTVVPKSIGEIVLNSMAADAEADRRQAELARRGITRTIERGLD